LGVAYCFTPMLGNFKVLLYNKNVTGLLFRYLDFCKVYDISVLSNFCQSAVNFDKHT
jgi:hypothetical protein